ncbi:hypothetical protein FRB90_011265 [Tulasnella sp. 427]|nr:hypothetical protein FRB90_011265 [Tulasnella sp. 427]
MSVPPQRPKGARPMPGHGGSYMNVTSPTSSPPEGMDSASATNPYLNARPRLNLNIGGGFGTPSPQPQPQQSSGSDSFSLRPNPSLVYGGGPAPAKKPALKLGLQIGKPTPSLNLAIPSTQTSRTESGNNSPSEAYESYYGIIPQPNQQPAAPPTNASLSTPNTEPFSAETIRPPIATIVPAASGSNSVRENEMSDLQKAIEAIQIREATDPENEDAIKWNNDMFESVRRLGEGAGGAVYQVKQKSTGKMMAMKTIPANPETPPRQLRRELEFLSTCIHPNITEFYGAYLASGTAGKYPAAEVVLLMEFCEGGSLETVSKKLREQKKRIGEQLVAKLALGTLQDIKPSNILLTREGVVKLCDFGVSGVLVNSMAGTFTGTSWYMSPERIRGDPYSIRSDVWSTGLTILELARNKFPYPPDLGPIELLSVIVNGDIPELEDEAPGPDGAPGAIWSQPMKDFVNRCLIIDGTRRPTPREILQDPWIVQNGNNDIDMEKWMRLLFNWPKPPKKGSRRPKQSDGGTSSTPSGSVDYSSQPLSATSAYSATTETGYDTPRHTYEPGSRDAEAINSGLSSGFPRLCSSAVQSTPITMVASTALHYDAPWQVYALDWCRTSGLGQQRIRSGFRLALGSFTEDYRNRISIIGLADERYLVDTFEDEGYSEGYGQSQSDFTVLAETMHGYPITKIAWEPASTLSQGWKGSASELLTSTGDALRIWEYIGSDADQKVPSQYVGRSAQAPGRLTQKIALSSLKRAGCHRLAQAKNPTPTSAPLTSFSWNTISPSLVVTSSIDTTCTVWDISANSAVTQLIAHDREVYDVAWVPSSTDSFVSVGADGSLRAFDLRSLEHSTILYEAPSPKTGSVASPQPHARPATSPLLRIAFNPLDPNFIATFHADSNDVQVLDMRSPGKPVSELRGHRAPVQAIGWGASEGSMLATAGDDHQLLVWDLSSSSVSPRQQVRSPALPEAQNQTRSVLDPTFSYLAPSEVNNLTWSPPMTSLSLGGGMQTAPGEWIAIATGKTVKVLKV